MSDIKDNYLHFSIIGTQEGKEKEFTFYYDCDSETVGLSKSKYCCWYVSHLLNAFENWKQAQFCMHLGMQCYVPLQDFKLEIEKLLGEKER